MEMQKASRTAGLTLLSLVTLLTSCDRLQESPTEVSHPQPPAQEPGLQYSSPIPTLDSDRPSDVPALYLAERIPGFGGFYFENQRLVVVLTRDADESIARQFVGDASEIVRPRVDEDSDVVIRSGEYSFSELRQWRDNINLWAFTLPDVVSTSLNQMKNRIVIGVADPEASAAVQARLTSADIPLEAVQVVRERRLRPNTGALQQPENGPTLRDYRRPIEGGLILARLWDAEGKGCTLGFNAIQDGWAHAVTASHCSSRFAAMEGTFFFQNQAIEDSIHFVGLEYRDPSPYGCGFFGSCRRSDATLLAVPAYVQVHQGYIARTTTYGSVIVDPLNPAFRITRHALWPQAGDMVHMIGQEIGWQRGKVTDIGKDIVGPDGVVLTDQVVADYKAGPGNSGAPVFIRLGGDSVALAGVHNGDNSEDLWTRAYRAYFSPLGAVMQELGVFDATAPSVPPPNVQVTIRGPTRIQPEANCTWQAVVDPPGGNYSYNWYSDGIHRGTGLYYTGGKDRGNLTDHFTLRVEVNGDGAGSQTITVYENPSARICFR
jgi:hypothetical protein